MAYHQEALATSTTSGDEGLQAEILNDFGSTLAAAGRYDEAVEHHKRAMRPAAASHNAYESARALDGQARVTLHIGHPAQARTLWVDALEIFDRLGTPEAAQIRAVLESLTS